MALNARRGREIASGESMASLVLFPAVFRQSEGWNEAQLHETSLAVEKLTISLGGEEKKWPKKGEKTRKENEKWTIMQTERLTVR